MPVCQSCGTVVTRAYVRVFVPEDVDAPRACPRCEDMVREGASVREKKY